MKVPIRQAAPLATQRRNGNNSNWPIRRADGRTFAEVRPQYQPSTIRSV
jgi:hypothetical protein